MKISKNILETIGNTPLVKLNKITNGLKPTILAKLEYFNPGGSIKDRIGIAMIETAEKAGLIKPGYTIVEPTSGNTGIGLALAAVVKGYKIIFTVPDKMSREKIDLLKTYGAKVIITPTAVPTDHPSNYVKVAEKIVEKNPKTFMPNQYFNPANPEIHYKTTGPEIWSDTNGKIDVLVAGMGTGGTITGTGRYLKEKNPNIRVVGVDPEGSMFHHEFYGTNGEIHSYRVEGIGEDFMPSTIDLKIVDEIITVSDKDAFLTTRRLAREDGILVGGSSGAAVSAALKVAKKLPKNKVVVVILPDTGRNYMNKLYSDEWMMEHGFIESVNGRIPVADILSLKTEDVQQVISVQPNDTIETAIDLMKHHNISQLPVIEEGIQVGSIREITLMKKLSTKEASLKQKIREVMEEPLPQIQLKDKILNPFLLLKDKNALLVLDDKKIVDIIATIDVINYYFKKGSINAVQKEKKFMLPKGEKEAWLHIVEPNDLDVHMATSDQAETNTEIVKELFRKNPLPEGSKLLIHGCGTAQMFDYIKPSDIGNAEMIFADISPRMLEVAQRRLKRLQFPYRTVVDDIENSIIREHCDAVLLILVLLHVDWKKTLENMIRLDPSSFYIIEQEQEPSASAVTKERKLPPSIQRYAEIATPVLIQRGELTTYMAGRGYNLIHVTERSVQDDKVMVGFVFNKRGRR